MTLILEPAAPNTPSASDEQNVSHSRQPLHKLSKT
jgi:hypothetical protein